MTATEEIKTNVRSASLFIRQAFSNPPKSITARTSPSKYAFTRRRSPYYILPLIFAAAAYCVWYLSFANGLFDALTKATEQDKPRFPGTQEPLVLKYVGVDVIDKQLAVLVSFFGPALNFSMSDLTLYNIFGLGQFGAGWTLLVLESFRKGNERKLVSYIGTYGFFVQNLTFAISTPIYLLLHLCTSPVASTFPSINASSVLLVAPHDLAILPFSVILGYLLPSILMALPAPEAVSFQTHQYLIALWQPFPLWTLLIHAVLKRTYLLMVGPKPQKATESSKAIAAPSATYLSSVGRVYTFVLALCIITHLPVVLIALFPPHLVPTDWPEAFALTQSTLLSVFVPPAPLPNRPIASLSAGCHTFLQWDLYVASSAALVWAIAMYRNASVEKEVVDPKTSLPVFKSGDRSANSDSTIALTLRILGWTLVAGPFGAVTVLLWQRDAIVKQKIKQGI